MTVSVVQVKRAGVAASPATVTFDNPTVTGNAIILCVSAGRSPASGVIDLTNTMVTDNSSGIYEIATGTETAVSSGTDVTLAQYVDTSIIGRSSHQLTFTSGVAANVLYALEVSGLYTNPSDQGTGATVNTSTPTVGPTGILAQADELAIAFGVAHLAASGTSITEAGGWTLVGELNAPAGGEFGNSCVYKIVSLTDTVSHQWTLAGYSSNAWIHHIGTYRGSPVTRTGFGRGRMYARTR